MKKIKEYKNAAGDNYATLYSIEEEKCIHDSWHGTFGKQENFRCVLTDIKDEVVSNPGKYDKWLADLSGMKGNWDSSRDFVATYIMPKVISRGIKKEAIILPRNIFAKLSTSDAISKTEGGAIFEMKYFDDLEDGKRWLFQEEAYNT